MIRATGRDRTTNAPGVAQSDAGRTSRAVAHATVQSIPTQPDDGGTQRPRPFLICLRIRPAFAGAASGGQTSEETERGGSGAGGARRVERNLAAEDLLERDGREWRNIEK